MHGGRVIADASPAALEQQLEAEVGRVVELGAEPLSGALNALRAAGHPETAAFGRQLHFLSREPQTELERLRPGLERAGIRLLASAERRPCLEDVFVHYIGALERGEAKP
jgi:ABC-2 type transport system ATP-binding protein